MKCEVLRSIQNFMDYQCPMLRIKSNHLKLHNKMHRVQSCILEKGQEKQVYSALTRCKFVWFSYQRT